MSGKFTKKLKSILTPSLLGLIIVLSPASALAASDGSGSAYFTMTPNSGTFNIGDYLTLNINENSGTTGVNAVQADISYDPGLLAFQSINAAGSAFPAEMPAVGGGSIVKISRAILGDGSSTPVVLTGDKYVASVTFKIIGAGSTQVNWANSSSIKAPINSTTIDEIWNGVTKGATFSIAAPQAPGYTGGGTTGGGGSTSTTTTGSGAGTSGSTSGGGKTIAKAGASTAPPAGSTTVPLTNQETTSQDPEPQALTPTLHTVSIKVVDSKGKPVAGAKVSLDGQVVHSLSDGTAGFIGIADGEHKLVVNHDGKTTTQTIKVDASGQPLENVQNFKVKLAGSRSLLAWSLYVGLGLLVVFLIGLLIPRRRHPLQYSGQVNPNTVVVGDSKNTPPPAAPVQPAKIEVPPPVQPNLAPGTYIQPTESNQTSKGSQEDGKQS